jgi:hypothetical protein
VEGRSVTDHRALAERLAASDYGDGWLDAAERVRRVRTNIWMETIRAIEAAGLAIVEREDGR